jgi:uncharacterized membrane protein YgcG
MRLPEHNALWEKIRGFSFDDPKAAIRFSNKLATQQKWSGAYTQRVIEEYRRFIFLCCISPNGASPSKAVDEAWHLHLTYTQSYWIAFCKNTLGKDIHHHPSAGGAQENHKHEQWYAETLALYEEVFGTRPPADVWPAPIRKQFTVPLTEWRMQNMLLLTVGLVMLTPFVISYIVYDEVFPFALRGPQFLVFYLLLSAAALIGFYMIRKDKNRHLQRIVDDYFPGDMNIYQLSHLVYGKHRAVQTGVIDLYRRNLLTIADNGDITVHNKKYVAPPKEENPLVPGFLAERDGDTINYEMIAVNWYTASPFEHPRIELLNRLTYGKEPWNTIYLVIIMTVGIGAARVFQGIYNDKPVIFLVLEIIALTLITLYLDKKLIRDNALLQKIEEQLWQKAGSGSLSHDSIVSEFAASGHSALAGIGAGVLLSSVFSSYVVPPLDTYVNSDTGSASRRSNSCSGAGSCSGGSSCGGGGCGGCGGGGD